MGRSPVRRVDVPRRRSALNALLVAGIAVVLALAAVGVVSTGNFLSGKLSTSATRTPTPRPVVPAANPTSVARARSQATAIVEAAHAQARTIIRQATNQARQQARQIVGRANRQATVVSSQVAAPPAAPTAVAPGGSATGPLPTPAAVAPLASPPNLSGVPASWLVVGYGATFGRGPGSAGSITVVNRSRVAFSGVAVVQYLGARGIVGSASAPFSRLAPGQTEVLALNGPPYPGHGYRIVLSGLRHAG